MPIEAGLVQPNGAGANGIGARTDRGARVQAGEARATSSSRRARLTSTWTTALLAGSGRVPRWNAAAKTRAAVRCGGATAAQGLTRGRGLAQARVADLRAASDSRIASASIRGAGAASIGSTAGLASVPRRATGAQAVGTVAAITGSRRTRGAYASTGRKRAVKPAISGQTLGPAAALIAKLAELIRLDTTRRFSGVTSFTPRRAAAVATRKAGGIHSAHLLVSVTAVLWGIDSDDAAIRIHRHTAIEQVRRPADIAHAIAGLAVVASAGPHRVVPALHRTVWIESTAAAGICRQTEVSRETATTDGLTDGCTRTGIDADARAAVGSARAWISVLDAPATSAAADRLAETGASVSPRANVAATIAVSQTDVAIGLATVRTDADAALAIGRAAVCSGSASLADDPARLSGDGGARAVGAGRGATIRIGTAPRPDVQALLR